MANSLKPSTLLKHLRTYIPRLTPLFSNNITVVGLIIDGATQTLRITSTAHGLLNGASINIVNALLDNSITAVSAFTDTDGTTGFRFTTSKEHDLTLGYEDNLTNGQIQLRGFTNSAFNGYFDLYDVPSLNTFEIASSLTIPILNGNEVLREQREFGLNGTFIIQNVTLNTYDVLLTGLPAFCALAVPQINIITGYKISCAADFARAQAIYTKQATNGYWMFLIMDDAIVSRDRNIKTDAVNTFSAQNEQRMRVVNKFAIDVFIPSSNDLSGSQASELAWGSFLEYLIGVMCGIPIETFEDTLYLTSFIDHATLEYNAAYYGHGYSFEYVYDITDLKTFTQNFITSRRFDKHYTSFHELENGSNAVLDSSYNDQ